MPTRVLLVYLLLPLCSARAATLAPGAPREGVPPHAFDDPVLRAIRAGDESVAGGGGDSPYDPAGRRDPFVDPIAAAPAGSIAGGLRSTRIAEVHLEGISLAGGEPVAILRSSEPMALFVREGDRLLDGTVISIDFAGGRVLFQQAIQDPDARRRFRVVEQRMAP